MEKKIKKAKEERKNLKRKRKELRKRKEKVMMDLLKLKIFLLENLLLNLMRLLGKHHQFKELF